MTIVILAFNDFRRNILILSTLNQAISILRRDVFNELKVNHEDLVFSLIRRENDILQLQIAMEAILTVDVSESFEYVIRESGDCDFFETRCADDLEQVVALEILKGQVNVAVVFVDLFDFR